jgi:membrane protease YdiL (CAAX protease family)
MQYKSNKGYTGFGQLGMILCFVGLGLILTTILQVVIGFQIAPPGTPLDKMSEAMLEAMKKPENLGAIRLMQVLSTFFLFFVPAMLFSFVCNGKNLFWLGFNKYFNVFQILLGFLIIFTANIMAGPLQELSEKIVIHFPKLNNVAKSLENAYNDQIIMLSHLSGIGDFISALIIMAFFPALFEELFFRGAIQTLLVKWWKKPLLAIVVTSVVFSLIHMSVYLLLSRIVLGFVLGWMFHQTKNIWINTIAHFLNNAIAVSQMYVLSFRKEKIDISKLDTQVDWWVGIIAIVVLFALFKFLNRYTEKNRMKIIAKEQSFLITENTAAPFS